MHVFLSGPMGSGKSTVAHAIANRLGTHAHDLDRHIEATTGQSIATIFAERGEPAFRKMERDALATLPTEAGVISLGAGTVADPSIRAQLLQNGIVITLTASPQILSMRVGKARNRPLLGAEHVETDIKRILAIRSDAYAEAHAVIDTSDLSPEEVIEEVTRVVQDAPVVVALGKRTYRVEIGAGIRNRLKDRTGAMPGGVAVLIDDAEDTERPWPEEAAQSLHDAGKRVIRVYLPRGEEHKTLQSVQKIWDTALSAQIDRTAVIIGIGGGVVGDLSAFAASTLLRGIPLGQLPTTLLSMVDSSVGGKTGFNHTAGKNLIGTFYQPQFVLCDVETLRTLPREERISGLAEVVKSAWLDGEEAVAMLEQDAEALLEGDQEATIRALRMSVALKARVVHQDETELNGMRMLLNLGHTVGHALERAEHYQGLRHGEAVALGMIAATRVAAHTHSSTLAQTTRLTRLLDKLGLPTDLDCWLTDRALDFIRFDKKRRADIVHFVVPRLPGQTEVVPLPISTLSRILDEHDKT